MIRLINILLEDNEKPLLFEGEFEDFFEFLNQDPKKGTIASVYYTAPMTVNKFYVDERGVKQPNPLFLSLYKHTRFTFRYADTYAAAIERKYGSAVHLNAPTGTYEKLQGYDIVRSGKSGLYFPIVPLSSKSRLTFVPREGKDWNNAKEVLYSDIIQYLPQRGNVEEGFTDGPPALRNLLLSRIYRIKAGGHVFTNPQFEFKYLGVD